MESNTWCPRLTAWIILSGSAVHVKAFGSALCSTTKRLIAACKSMTDRKTPRFNRLFVSLAKKAVRTPDALDGTRADIDDFRHHGGGPVGRLCWRLGLGEHHDAFVDVRPPRPGARGRALLRT